MGTRHIFVKDRSDLFSKYTLTNVQNNFDKPKHDDIDKSKMLRWILIFLKGLIDEVLWDECVNDKWLW